MMIPRAITTALWMALLIAAFALPAWAQPGADGAADTSAAPGSAGGAVASPAAPHWYDTLTVTQPRYARAAPLERLALAAFTALALPVGTTVGALTLLPPSINVLVED